MLLKLTEKIVIDLDFRLGHNNVRSISQQISHLISKSLYIYVDVSDSASLRCVMNMAPGNKTMLWYLTRSLYDMPKLFGVLTAFIQLYIFYKHSLKRRYMEVTLSLGSWSVACCTIVCPHTM